MGGGAFMNYMPLTFVQQFPNIVWHVGVVDFTMPVHDAAQMSRLCKALVY